MKFYVNSKTLKNVKGRYYVKCKTLKIATTTIFSKLKRLKNATGTSNAKCYTLKHARGMYYAVAKRDAGVLRRVQNIEKHVGCVYAKGKTFEKTRRYVLCQV